MRYNLGTLAKWWDEGEQDNQNRKVPDRLMRELVVYEGLGNTEVVNVLREAFGIDVTRSNVSYWRSRNGLPSLVRKSANRDKLVPWRVRVEHNNHRLYRFLLTEVQVRDGIEPDTASAYRHRSVERELKRRPGMVIFYDAEDGFSLVTGRDCDDDLIWDPRLP